MGESGHYAKCCCFSRRINHIAEEKKRTARKKMTGQPTEFTQYNRKSIHWVRTEKAVHCSIQQRYWSTTDLSVTLIPKSKFNNTTVMKPVTIEIRDVNNNRIKSEGKTTASVEMDGTKQQLELLITTKTHTHYSDSTE